jgi:triphosphoribosyl-dephospho-CoA synthase CitG
VRPILPKTKNPAQLAVKALLYEVCLPDKPGLVSPTGNPGHPDMNLYTFIDSALTLQPYFEKLLQLGENFQSPDLTQLFAEARKLGLQAEKDMLQATKGVNTHKGAIFSLGIAVVATAYAKSGKLPEIKDTIKKILKNLTTNDFKNVSSKAELTAGEKQYQQYGLTGIRGEAEAGFPSVFNIALPCLRQAQGNRNQRLMDTLMKIISTLPDSNLIKRAGGIEILDWMQEQTARYFKSPDKQKFLQQLNQKMTEKNLSLGGTADILILTIYFALLEDSTE